MLFRNGALLYLLESGKDLVVQLAQLVRDPIFSGGAAKNTPIVAIVGELKLDIE